MWEAHGRPKVEPVCPPKPKANEFNCSSCPPTHSQPLTTHQCVSPDRTTSPLPHGGETEAHKDERYTNTWVLGQVEVGPPPTFQVTERETSPEGLRRRCHPPPRGRHGGLHLGPSRQPCSLPPEALPELRDYSQHDFQPPLGLLNSAKATPPPQPPTNQAPSWGGGGASGRHHPPLPAVNPVSTTRLPSCPR